MDNLQPPEERESLRTYGELMTMLDNPKFPDQLSALGGDKDNYRLPWEKAAENPRSWFGVTRVVLHDGEVPKAELSHLRPLLAANEPASLADLAAIYGNAVEAVLKSWSEEKGTDDDVRWLDMAPPPRASPQSDGPFAAARGADQTIPAG